MDEISTVRAVIDLWPSRKALAEAVGASVAAVHKWAQAGAIPARFHQSVIDAGQAQGLPLTAEMMVRLHARPQQEDAA